MGLLRALSRGPAPGHGGLIFCGTGINAFMLCNDYSVISVSP